MTEAPAAAADDTHAPAAARSAAGVLRAVALAVAAVVGLTPALIIGRSPRLRHASDAQSRLDSALGPLRASLPPRAVVGFAVEDARNLAPWYLAQYSLAPAFVRPLVVAHCFAAAPDCGIAALDYVVERHPPGAPASRLVQVGFQPAAQSGEYLLFRKKAAR